MKRDVVAHLREQARIYDVPWQAVRVSSVDSPEGMDVQEYQVSRSTKW